MPKRLYKPYKVKADVERCKGCEDHIEHGGLKWGRCRSAGMSAYYSQLDGFCPKVAEELKVEQGRKRKGSGVAG